MRNISMEATIVTAITATGRDTSWLILKGHGDGP
jgi:hypothetical protein